MTEDQQSPAWCGADSLRHRGSLLGPTGVISVGKLPRDLLAHSVVEGAAGEVP